jgi:hypothetical protein
MAFVLGIDVADLDGQISLRVQMEIEAVDAPLDLRSVVSLKEDIDKLTRGQII